MSLIAEAPVAEERKIEPEGRYEVVRGVVVEKAPMGVFESGIAGRLFEALAPFARARRLGQVFSETIFRIDAQAGLERRPDLSLVTSEKWPVDRLPPRARVWDLVPDLAVEIISPSNSANEVQDKVHEYLGAGVRLVWVVWPLHGGVHVYESLDVIRPLRVSRDDVLDGGAVVPGFALPLTDLFGPLGEP